MDLNSIEIQIFVSCPSDVNTEKDTVKQLCDRVNKNLLQVGCNVRVTFRDFSEIIAEVGKRPQQVINDTIVGYDIYLGILFMRFGTPTGAVNPETGKEFESGTEEEFELALKERNVSGEAKQIYFFFKNQIGAKTSLEHEQAGKVLRFKERLQAHNWIHPFSSLTEFERDVYDLLYRETFKLCLTQMAEVKRTVILNESGNIAFEYKPNTDSFVPTLPDLLYYIPRSIRFLKRAGYIFDLFVQDEPKKLLLRNVLLEEKKIVLLGNAGTGKSIELEQLVKHFLRDNTPFIPIYRRLNTYNGEALEEFLPEGWHKISPEIIVILLDGLDEVQPQFFNTLIRKLIEFGDIHPVIRIVISCRTNFYELPDGTFSGTLTGYKVCVLNDISTSEIRDYITTQFDVDGDQFIRDAHQSSFFDLIQKPFFLNLLVKHYIENGNFSKGRNMIIESFLFSRIEFDREHFKTSVDISKTKEAILSVLEKVAFIMELIGKNYITLEELELILAYEEIDQIKHFSAFSKNPDKNQWTFEHNNLQEFLASKVLARQPFEKLIQVISFAPSHNRVKPTWVNTISFFYQHWRYCYG